MSEGGDERAVLTANIASVIERAYIQGAQRPIEIARALAEHSLLAPLLRRTRPEQIVPGEKDETTLQRLMNRLDDEGPVMAMESSPEGPTFWTVERVYVFDTKKREVIHAPRDPDWAKVDR